MEMSHRQYDTVTTRVVSVELKRNYEHYKSSTASVLGVFQIIFGLWSIALGIAHALTQTLFFGQVGYGIWGGVIYIIAGALGIASYKKSPNMIVAHMTFSIIAAVLALLQLCLGAASAYADRLFYTTGVITPGILPKDGPPYAGTIIVDSLLAVSAIMEGIVAIAAAAISCKVTCCNSKFTAAQQEIEHPHVRTYEVTESQKYVVNPQRF